MNNVRFCYWTLNMETGADDYHFMSSALLDEGIIVKNTIGQPCMIVDVAAEVMGPSCAELRVDNAVRRMI